MGVKLENLRIRIARIQQRWALTWKEVAVVLALAYFTPIGGTRAGTYHFPLVMFSHLIAIAVLISWTAHRFRQRRWLPRTPLDLPLLGFYLLNVISTAFSTERRLSLENLLHLTIFILIYYVVVDLLISGWTVSSFVRPMMVIGSVMIIAELLELALWLGIWYVQVGELSPLLALSDYRRRIIMGPANVLAWYLILLLPLALAQLLMARSLRSRINLSGWTIGAILVFTSTLSRSGLLGMIAGLAALGVLTLMFTFQLSVARLLSSLRRPAVVAGIVLTLLLGAFLSTFGLRLVYLRMETILTRFELWRAGVEMIVSRPFLGGGPGTFGYLFHQLPDFNPANPDMSVNNAHNGYINVAAETGLPSLLVGLWLIATLVATSLRGAAKPDDGSDLPGLVTSACLAGMVGLLAAMLFDVLWVFPLMTLYVIVFAAIILKPYSAARRLTMRPMRWMIPIAIGVVAGMLVWTDTAHYFQQRAVEAMDDHDLPAAADALQKSTSIDPFLAIYSFQLGIAEGYLGLERGDSAMLRLATAGFEAEISRGGDTAVNNGNLAWLEWEAGDIEEAVSHMQRAATLAPRDMYYQLSLGYLLEETGQYEAAKNAYATAIAVYPGLIDSGFWRATEYRRSIKPGLLEEAALLVPSLPYQSQDQTALTLARMAYFAHDWARATRILERLPQSADSRVLRAGIAAEQGEYETALEHLAAALALDEANPAAYLARGQVYLRLGDESKAVRDLIIASSLGVQRADISLGEIAYQAGNLGSAIAQYQRGIPLCRRLASRYHYASHVYHRSDLGADFWPDSIGCTPYDSLVPEYLHLARAYGQTGQSEQADELCRWLAIFYEPAYLTLLDDEANKEWPCPDHRPHVSHSVG